MSDEGATNAGAADAGALPDAMPEESSDESVETPDHAAVNDPLTLPNDEQLPDTQGDDPLIAELGEEGQGDLAPEDEPDGFSGDEEPRDLRDEL